MCVCRARPTFSTNCTARHFPLISISFAVTQCITLSVRAVCVSRRSTLLGGTSTGDESAKQDTKGTQGGGGVVRAPLRPPSSTPMSLHIESCCLRRCGKKGRVCCHGFAIGSPQRVGRTSWTYLTESIVWSSLPEARSCLRSTATCDKRQSRNAIIDQPGVAVVQDLW